MNNKKYNKQLFIVEAVVGVATSIMTIAMIVIGGLLVEVQPLMGVLIMVISMVAFVVICLGLTKMEQIVGYYQCEKCHHKHVPTYSSVLWSMHCGRTRYLKCPKCHKNTWQKKVLD